MRGGKGADDVIVLKTAFRTGLIDGTVNHGGDRVVGGTTLLLLNPEAELHWGLTVLKTEKLLRGLDGQVEGTATVGFNGQTSADLVLLSGDLVLVVVELRAEEVVSLEDFV